MGLNVFVPIVVPVSTQFFFFIFSLVIAFCF